MKKEMKIKFKINGILEQIGYVQRNVIIISLCFSFCIFVTSLFLINFTERDLGSSNLRKLISLNQKFKKDIDRTIMESFSSIKIVSQMSNSKVALTYNMEHQFILSIKDIVSINNIALFDKNGTLLYSYGTHKSAFHQDYSKILASGSGANEFIYYHNKTVIYCVKVLSNEKLLGYLAGAAELSEIKPFVTSKYLEYAGAFSNFLPSIELTIEKDQPKLQFRYQSNNTFSRLNVSSIVIIALASVFAIILSALLIQRFLSKPINQINDIIDFISNNEERIYSKKLPKDKVFKKISKNLLNMHRKRLDIEKILLEKKKHEAILKTTQMVAHDVKKPFSMLQGVLEVLPLVNTLEEVNEFADIAKKDISHAMQSVMGILQDIMEIGSNAPINKEAVDPELLIENTLLENFRFDENMDITFIYQLNHSYKVMVDTTKISRVFSNIVANAAQATSKNGTIWFYTNSIHDNKKPFVKFTIGNNNSYIPPETQERIFDTFYTSNKKGGTGLGLAIAKKILASHGGSIWCTSCQVKGTEFHFTLPQSEEKVEFFRPLVTLSKHILNNFTPLIGQPGDAKQQFEREAPIEKAILNTCLKQNLSVAVLVIDDEPLYLNLLKNQITVSKQLLNFVHLDICSSGEEGLRICKQKQYDIIIVDVDMGTDHIDGFETVYWQRQMGVTATIIIHSNRGLIDYQKKALDSRADLFIAKTMPREHFLKIIYSVVDSKQRKEGTRSKCSSPDVTDAPVGH